MVVWTPGLRLETSAHLKESAIINFDLLIFFDFEASLIVIKFKAVRFSDDMAQGTLARASQANDQGDVLVDQKLRPLLVPVKVVGRSGQFFVHLRVFFCRHVYLWWLIIICSRLHGEFLSWIVGLFDENFCF
jgi:hypothetical protein